jgi:NitT/TauT family transport system ATP-binding protein
VVVRYLDFAMPTPTATQTNVTLDGSAAAAIHCDGVGRTYPKTRGTAAVEALSPTTVTMEPGTITVLIGPSGCGKSTLLRLIGGLDLPTTGTITVANVAAEQARRSKRFGFVPQAPTLLSWRTVRDNVRLLTEVNPSAQPAVPDAAIDAMIASVGLSAFAQAKPRTLSGGMAQRVALARAFVLGAEVLLLDEPFAALDEFTRADMRHLLADLWRQHRSTVVFTTHDLHEAVLLADRILVMSPRPGRIVADIAVGFARPTPQGFEDDATYLAKVREVRSALQEAVAMGHQSADRAGFAL